VLGADSTTGLVRSASTPTASTNFPAGTNQLNVNGSNFDAAGNMLHMGGWTYKYDGDDHQINATLNSATSKYGYDAEGRRV
jgi:hypothetical protein